MTLKFICFPLPSTRPAPEHLSFPLGSPLLCFILTWARADQTFSSRFFSSSSPPSAAEALQLISRFQCFMYNAAGPFIKVKMSVRAEGRPEVQGQRDLTAERGEGLSDRGLTKISLFITSTDNVETCWSCWYFAPISVSITGFLSFMYNFCFIMVERVCPYVRRAHIYFGKMSRKQWNQFK